MFDIGPLELLVLIVIAVVIFGPERLPEFARKAARVVKYVRGIAGNAQQQISQELGPGFEDVDFRDLNPKAFIQKHLLDDVEPIVADVKKEISAAGVLGAGAAASVNGAVRDARRGGKADASTNGSSANGSSANGSSVNGSSVNGSSVNGSSVDEADDPSIDAYPIRVLTPFDVDAT